MFHRFWLLLACIGMSATALAQEPLTGPSRYEPATSVGVVGADYQMGAYERALPQGADSTVVEAARGCDLADLDACMILGMAYVRGDGVSANRELGMFILADACDQGYDTACAMARRYASN